MAYRQIVKIGDELLRKQSKIVKNFNQSLWDLLDDMAESMFKFKGMGLAAPQIGVLKRVVVMDVNGMFLEFVNPEIISSSGEEEDEEACLSVPNVRGIVKRPLTLTVKAQDRNGNNISITCEKMLARCVCHELDHLDGILFVDKMEREIKGNK